MIAFNPPSNQRQFFWERWVRFDDAEIYLLRMLQGVICFVVVDAAQKSHEVYRKCSGDFTSCSGPWKEAQTISAIAGVFTGSVIVKYGETAYQMFPIIQRIVRACFPPRRPIEERNPSFLTRENYILWIFQLVMLGNLAYITWQSEIKYLKCIRVDPKHDCSPQLQSYWNRHELIWGFLGGVITHCSETVFNEFSPAIRRGMERVWTIFCCRREN